jgi:NADP-dependent 3-hydroxy acid dehydrogenase YdfG
MCCSIATKETWMDGLKGKGVLVTGAASGIGRATVERLL